MLAILPQYRVTEEYEYGPVTVHHEEGPIGFRLAFAEGQSEALDGEWPGARGHAVTDILAFCGIGDDPQSREIFYSLAYDDRYPMVTIDEAIAADQAITRWFQSRRDAWLVDTRAALAIADPDQ